MFFLAAILDKDEYGILINHKDEEFVTLQGEDYQNNKTSKVIVRKETLPVLTQLLMAANYCIANEINVHMDYVVEIIGHEIVEGYLGLLTEEDAYKALNIDPSRREREEFDVLLIAPPYNKGTFSGVYVGQKIKLHYHNFQPFNPDNEDEYDDSTDM